MKLFLELNTQFPCYSDSMHMYESYGYWNFEAYWKLERVFQYNADKLKRQMYSMKSQGFLQTPQEIMEEYNGCSISLCTLPRVSTHKRPTLSFDVNQMQVFRYEH